MHRPNIDSNRYQQLCVVVSISLFESVEDSHRHLFGILFSTALSIFVTLTGHRCDLVSDSLADSHTKHTVAECLVQFLVNVELIVAHAIPKMRLILQLHNNSTDGLHLCGGGLVLVIGKVPKQKHSQHLHVAR